MNMTFLWFPDNFSGNIILVFRKINAISLKIISNVLSFLALVFFSFCVVRARILVD